jgi:hypothetical protein
MTTVLVVATVNRDGEKRIHRKTYYCPRIVSNITFEGETILTVIRGTYFSEPLTLPFEAYAI